MSWFDKLPVAILMAVAVLPALAPSATAAPSHAYVAEGGEPRYGPDFTHYDFANPEAIPGCTLKVSTVTPFNSLNPWIVKGRAAISVYFWLYDSLLEEAPAELLTGYGLIAHSVDPAPDRQSATFHMRPEAHFHDGVPITAHDVVFTADQMRQHAGPFWRSLLHGTEVTALDAHTVRVVFTRPVDSRAILGFGAMPILPTHYWRDRSFGDTTVEPPLGSGPYRIAEFKPLRRIVWERAPNYWARNHPVRRGANNFERVSYEVYLDKTTQLVAFLKGDVDIFQIGDLRQWQAHADQVAGADGRIATLTYDAFWPMGMNGFFFNMRDDRFADRRVRQALAMLMPFEWVNRTMLTGAFKRTSSYFENSAYAAATLPDEGEQAEMRRWPDTFPPEAFETVFVPADAPLPKGIRGQLRAAAALLKEAGWAADPETTRMRRIGDGRSLDFSVLAQTDRQAGLFGAWAEQLRRLGIEARLRVVDPAAYQVKWYAGDFEMIYRFYIPSPIPGREQISLWGSKTIRPATPLSPPDGGNPLGIDSPAIDSFLNRLVAAPERDARVRATRLLDRALQWGHYAVPGYQARHRYYAYNATRVVPLPAAPGMGSPTDFWWCKQQGQ